MIDLTNQPVVCIEISEESAKFIDERKHPHHYVDSLVKIQRARVDDALKALTGVLGADLFIESMAVLSKGNSPFVYLSAQGIEFTPKRVQHVLCLIDEYTCGGTWFLELL